MTKSLSTLMPDALAPVFEQKRAITKKIYSPDYARFRLQCKKPDGETSVPYPSYDTHKGMGGMTITDEEEGLRKLIKLGEKKIYTEGFRLATIWANVTTDTRTFINGKMSKSYNVVVWMMVHGKASQLDSHLKFVNGVMDIEYMIRMIKERRAAL